MEHDVKALRKLGELLARGRRSLDRLPGDWRMRRRTALRNSSSLANRLHFEAVEPRLLLAADVPPVMGTIEVPGETDRFAFTLTEPKKVVFDSLTATNNMFWALADQKGSIVSNRNLAQSDSYDFSGGNVLDLQAGEYTLSIDGRGDATGNYAFRLLDIANADADRKSVV